MSLVPLLNRSRPQEHDVFGPMHDGVGLDGSPVAGYNYKTSDVQLQQQMIRRERNRQAAMRCRERQRQRTYTLAQEVRKLEETNSRLQREVSQLQSEAETINNFLRKHNSECAIGQR